MAGRASLDAADRECVTTARAAGMPTVVAGDMNAAMFPTDRDLGAGGRPARYTQDVAWAATATGLGLQPIDTPPPGRGQGRLRTYRAPQRGLVSRIDDVLVARADASAGQHAPQGHATTRNTLGFATDHDSLVARMPWAALGTSAPQRVLARPGEAHKSLALPLSQADKEGAKSAIVDEHGQELTQIRLELSAAVTGHVLPHWEAFTRADPGQRRPLTQLGGESRARNGGTAGQPPDVRNGGGPRNHIAGEHDQSYHTRGRTQATAATCSTAPTPSHRLMASAGRNSRP
jgi:hypothetical protein